jgi:hypothetical protein
VVLPAGGHFQGIQRFETAPDRLVLTSDSDTEAYFVICDVSADGSRGRARPPNKLSVSPLRHAGGCQVVEGHLVVGVDDSVARTSSEIRFWRLTARPAELTGLTVRRRGAYRRATAGAVGLSSFQNGAALAVVTWNSDTIDFYLSAGDPFRGHAQFNFLTTWSRTARDQSGWIDPNFGRYQSVNLLTQQDGALFMSAFNRNADGEDWLDLFAVHLDRAPERILTKVAKKHMFCRDGCSFEAGSGISIASTTRFEAYAVNGSSGDHVTGATIHINHFR